MSNLNEFLYQLAKQEHLNTSSELNASTTRSRLNELEGVHQNIESENTQLRRDKMLLVDHVSNLQKQVGRSCFKFNVLLSQKLYYLSFSLNSTKFISVSTIVIGKI